MITCLGGVDDDGEAERDEEDGVDQCAEDLRPCVAKGAAAPGPSREADGEEGDEEGEHVGEHVEGVGHEGVGARPLPHHQLHQEEGQRQDQHQAEAERLAPGRAQAPRRRRAPPLPLLDDDVLAAGVHLGGVVRQLKWIDPLICLAYPKLALEVAFR